MTTGETPATDVIEAILYAKHPNMTVAQACRNAGIATIFPQAREETWSDVAVAVQQYFKCQLLTAHQLRAYLWVFHSFSSENWQSLHLMAMLGRHPFLTPDNLRDLVCYCCSASLSYSITTLEQDH